jgi:hypothetical protein
MNSAGASRTRIPTGLFGMLVLIVLIERGTGRPLPQFRGDESRWDWRLTAEAVERPDAVRADVLFFGDSLVKRGIYPRLVEAGLGFSSFNLAVPGGLPPASYFLLKRVLDAGARPRAIVIDAYPLLLPFRTRRMSSYWPELLRLGEALELSLISRDVDMLATTTLGVMAPSVAHREAIRDRLMAALRGEAGPSPDLVPAQAITRNWWANRGVLVAPAMAPAPPGAEATRSVARLLGPVSAGKAWSPHPVNTGYLRRFLDLAAEHRLPVFWLIPPVGPRHRADMRTPGIEACYLGFVESLQSRYGNLVVIDGREAPYGEELFIDGAHLNREGACAFSRAVSDVLARYLKGRATTAAPRWVSLPAGTVPDGTESLEDLQQSMLAIGTNARPTRR